MTGVSLQLQGSEVDKYLPGVINLVITIPRTAVAPLLSVQQDPSRVR
jgi:hypothetical protein